MKNTILLTLISILIFSILITGCTTNSSINESKDNPDLQMPIKPDFNNNQIIKGDIAYTPLVIEKGNIFTDRDLNQNPDLSNAITIKAENNSEYTINSEGIYVLTGKASNFTVIVQADKKNDKVQIVLNNVEITNDNFPIIYVKSADKCFVTLINDNSLSVKEKYISDNDTNADAVIYSKEDLTLNGSGSLKILSANGNGITCKDDMKITGGSYDITSGKDAIEANDSISIYQATLNISTSKDGLHCENDEGLGSIYFCNGTFTINAKDDGIQATESLVIDEGRFNITASEGLEATYVQINGGNISINASDDGINAVRKSNNEYDPTIEINGGDITIVMSAGDTDGLDANGVIVVNGGTIDVSGRSTFDADRGTIYNGGTIIINGVKTDSIPSSTNGFNGMGNKGDRNFNGNQMNEDFRKEDKKFNRDQFEKNKN